MPASTASLFLINRKGATMANRLLKKAFATVLAVVITRQTKRYLKDWANRP